MTEANTGTAGNQAATDTPEYLDAYTTAAADVADVIGTRDSSHGHPEAFAATFAGMLNCYLLPVLSRAGRIGPADAFVVLDLMKSARIAVGGPHPDHFTDKAGYGLLGLVHTQRAFAAVAAYQTQQSDAAHRAFTDAIAPDPYEGDNGELVIPEGAAIPPTGTPGRVVTTASPGARVLGSYNGKGSYRPNEAPEVPRGTRKPAPEADWGPKPLVLEEGGLYPPTGLPGQDVLSCDGRHLGTFNAQGYFRTVSGQSIEEATSRPVADEAEPEEPAEDPGPKNWRRPAGGTGLDDPNRDPVDDIDLLRWALDPAGNPFADLFVDADGASVPRLGVTREVILERQRRVLDLLRNHVESTDEGANRLARAIERYGKLAA